jgi:hypothetical protein
VAALAAAGAPTGRARLWAQIWRHADVEAAVVAAAAAAGC